ncbi:MAG TPA: efflux RND transporter permease subunit, partial [Gemmatimonadaceae bacterium]|nr:efflux RND transporter permease subunit [Gemmatimonadaceae bacterium]
IVVRNAIILVDYANELRRQGMELETAALLAGRRRLRPIFLTTMAAALGVTPMILSGSPLWSPMASVIAVGLVVSMIFTLVVVPVLYVVVERRVERRAARRVTAGEGVLVAPTSLAAAARAAAVLLGALLAIGGLSSASLAQDTYRTAVDTAPAAPPAGPDARRLTLEEAIGIALERSAATRVAAARLGGAAAHERAAAADYLPRLGLTANRIQGSGRTTIVVPQGVLGNDGTGAPIPGEHRRFDQGTPALTYGQLSLTQPVTQLYRIRQARSLAAAQRRGAEAEQWRAERDVSLAVERLYLGVLVAREKTRAAEHALAARRRQQQDADAALAAGTTLSAQAAGARAGALEAEYALVAARNEADDLEAELCDLLALPLAVSLDLVVPEPDTAALPPLSRYVALAQANSPDVAAAAAQVAQAERATALARADYIPDIGVGVTYSYQHGVAFLPEHSAALAIQGSWTVWDFGKRGATALEREAGVRAAAIALEHARDRATVEVEKAYRKAERASHAAAAARAALGARADAARVANDQQARGVVAVANRFDADASLAAARARLAEAELGARLARAELAHAAGVWSGGGARRGVAGPGPAVASRRSGP